MRACVFVDGENLRHTLRRLFSFSDYLPKKADWGSFFDRIVDVATDSQAQRLRTYWYVVQHFDARPWPLKKSERLPTNFDSWSSSNKKYLRNVDLTGTSEEKAQKFHALHDQLQKNLDLIRARFDGFHTAKME